MKVTVIRLMMMIHEDYLMGDTPRTFMKHRNNKEHDTTACVYTYIYATVLGPISRDRFTTGKVMNHRTRSMYIIIIIIHIHNISEDQGRIHCCIEATELSTNNLTRSLLIGWQT